MEIVNLPGHRWDLAGTHLTGPDSIAYVALEPMHGFIQEMDVLIFSKKASITSGESLCYTSFGRVCGPAELIPGERMEAILVCLVRPIGG